MSTKNGRFAEGQRNRQKALSYIIANPNAVGPQIAAAMGWDKSINSTRLTRMTDDGDVERELTQYSYRNTAGGLCNVTTYSYLALREKTRPADEARAQMARNVNPTKRQQAVKQMKAEAPGITRNVDPDRKPLSNQGGQGAIRRQVHIGSAL